jgi:formylglycine-generating enzyme required for sulfatase activity
MKKLYTVLAILTIIATACQLGGTTQAEPTPIPFVATAFPSPTAVPLNPTAAPPSGAPNAGTERASGVDGMTQVYLPEGIFMRGGLDANTESNELPAVKVTLRGFWMDKVEVTNGMYLLCFQAGVCDLPRYGSLTLSKSETRPSYFRNPEYNDYPVVYVTWGSADAYCKWAGRRLPTEAEWEYGARGAFPSLNTFPWGDQLPDSSYANFNYYVGDTTRVGSFPAGASPFGLLDMSGNVAEWVNDFYDANYYSQGVTLNPSGPIARSRLFSRVARGGSFGDSWQNIRVSKRISIMGPDPSEPIGSDRYYGVSASTVGFRCASDN